METSRRRFLQLSLATGGVLASSNLLAACGSGGAASSDDTLVIGAASGFTGGFAPWGLQYLQAMRTGVTLVNNGKLAQWSPIVQPSGGVKVGGKTYKMEVESADTKYDPSVSVQAVRKLVSQGVKYMLGPLGETTANVAENEMFTQNKVLQLQLSTLWQSLGPQWPLSFNLLTDMQDYWQNVYQWVVTERPEIRKIAVVTTDQTYGRLGVTIANKWANDTGKVEIVYQQVLSPDATDYNPAVTAALAKDPDLIDIGGAADPNAFAGIVAAAHQQGFTGKVGADGRAVKFLATSYADNVMLAKIPESYYEGAVMGYPTASWGADGPTGEAKWFYQQMMANGGKPAEWNTVTPTGYLALRIFLEGLRAADDTDPTKIASALGGLSTISTPLGDATWTGKELSGVDAALALPQRVLMRQNGRWNVAATTTPPFTWDYDFSGLPYSDEFAPNK
jgi:branched-chain amino acid transport system substrate-binding protein